MTREDDSDAPVPQPAADDEVSRRVFVHHLTFLGGGAVLLGGCKQDEPKAPPPPKQALTSSHRTFTDGEWLTLAAAVERMLPKDEDPGAVEAGVPEYIDRMLQTEQLATMKQNFVPGLAALDRRAQRMFQKAFHQCSVEQQDELITLFKNSPEKSGEARWYEMFVVLVLEGYLGDPSYGGNKGEVGWKLVGFNLVGRNVKGDPRAPYDGSQRLHQLVCGGGKGC
jgi:gluconate 2-dehydrogenase gamma chain